MIVYEEFNINPKGKKTGDCSIRALALATDQTWDDALDELVAIAHKTKWEPADRRSMEKALEAHGFANIGQPRKSDNTKYLVRELDQVLKGMYVAVINVANHYTVIKSGVLYDTWNCGCKAAGKIYIKGTR